MRKAGQKGRGASSDRHYANASDYVRDLIRTDQERNDKIAAMQRFVDDGLRSGAGDRTKDALFATALKRAETARDKR